MKVQILRNASGKVLATLEVGTGNAVPVKVEARKGHTTQETDAPAQYTKDLGAFYKTQAKAKRRQAAKR